jgi:hypothetical protein
MAIGGSSDDHLELHARVLTLVRADAHTLCRWSASQGWRRLAPLRHHDLVLRLRARDPNLVLDEAQVRRVQFWLLEILPAAQCQVHAGSDSIRLINLLKCRNPGSRARRLVGKAQLHEVDQDDFSIKLTRDQALVLSDWLDRMMGTRRVRWPGEPGARGLVAALPHRRSLGDLAGRDLHARLRSSSRRSSRATPGHPRRCGPTANGSLICRAVMQACSHPDLRRPSATDSQGDRAGRYPLVPRSGWIASSRSDVTTLFVGATRAGPRTRRGPAPSPRGRVRPKVPISTRAGAARAFAALRAGLPAVRGRRRRVGWIAIRNASGPLADSAPSPPTGSTLQRRGHGQDRGCVRSCVSDGWSGPTVWRVAVYVAKGPTASVGGVPPWS